MLFQAQRKRTGLLRSLSLVGADSSLKTEDCSRRSAEVFGRVGVLEYGFLQEGNTRDLAPSKALHEGESTCSVGWAYRRQGPHNTIRNISRQMA